MSTKGTHNPLATFFGPLSVKGIDAFFHRIRSQNYKQKRALFLEKIKGIDCFQIRLILIYFVLIFLSAKL